jgi:hypothetical protein
MLIKTTKMRISMLMRMLMMNRYKMATNILESCGLIDIPT